MACAGGDIGTLTDKEILDIILKFHEKHARQPTEGLREAKQVLMPDLDKLRIKLKAMERCDRNEFTGSSYQGVKISNDLEFDILFIQDVTGSVIYDAVADRPSYMNLKLVPDKGADMKYRSSLDGGFISATKFGNDFFGALQKCLNLDDMVDFKRRVTLRRHGPACQMDFKRNDQIWFSVDMVPTMEIREPDGVRRFVAKPFKGGDQTMGIPWRISHSLEEKKQFDAMDGKDNGCRKQCLRVLKALLVRETNLKKLTTYYLKTILLSLLREKPDLSWKQNDIGARVLDLLARLQEALETATLPNYYIAEVNLLADIKPATLLNMACRIQVIRKKRTEFTKAFRE